MKELRDPKALRRLLADIGELARKTGGGFFRRLLRAFTGG